jgi:hypothetical protein
MARRFLIAAAVMAVGAVFLAPSAAQGAFGIAEWEAITCKENADTPGLGGAPVSGLAPLPQDSGQCTKDTPNKWFTQAAGHPNFGITDFTLNTFSEASGIGGFPEGFVKTIVVDTPEGLSVNPEATPTKCTVDQLSADPPECPATSLVGINYLTVAAGAPNPGTGKCEKEVAPGTIVPLPSCPQARVALPVYNLVPFDGVPSMVGFPTSAPGEPTLIVGSLSPLDQHVTFTISDIHAPSGATHPPIIGSRLVFFGDTVGNPNPTTNGTYLTMPSNCGPGQTSVLHVESHEGASDEAAFTTAVGASGCELVPFKPTIDVTTQGGEVDTPLPTTVDVGIPFNPAEPIANSYLKTAKVILPEGMGINPSSAVGLGTCTDAQFAKGTNVPIACPDNSKIGTVEVQTPSLPPDSLGGTVYVGEPLKNGPGASSSGEQFRIFIHATSARYGVNVRLVGEIFPDPTTGRLTAVVEDNPQATFSNFRLHLNGGSRGTLTSPNTCTNKTETDMTPWSGNLDQNRPSDELTLTSLPGGGACPRTLAERPFAPVYTAKSDSTTGGAYSPFRVVIARKDGQQELKVVNVTLPKGLTGKLAGIPYCPDASLAAAATNSGKAEKANSSCPADSLIGTTSTRAGSGTAPLQIDGKAFLAGPYKGAPLSMAVITPGVAGPYDIGTVVVRVALNVNPETAQINAVSDPIPNVFGGVKLDLRRIDVNVDRNQFMLNPTNCAAQATSGVLNGGGADPTNPASFSSYGVSAPYQATDCSKLGFRPKLYTRLYGPTKRAKNPRIRAILEARTNDANISRTALTLPHSLFLDQSHIRTVCTRVQLKAKACPKASVYGQAVAKSPLLDRKLKGPVYLVSSDNPLPDLVADLRGQVNIQLHGIISSKRGGIKTVFTPVPDVPVKKFILNMRGGKKSLLVNSRNLCKTKQRSVLKMKAQNGKKLTKKKLPLKVSGCSKKKKK